MIKKVSAIAADIDGTLVTKGSDMMPVTRNALIRLHEKGVLIGIATGRSISSGMLRRHEDWGLPFQFDFFIGINGGQLLDGSCDKVQNFYLLSEDILKEILEMMAPLDLPAQMYEGDDMVATKIDEMILASMKRNHTDMIDAHGDISRLYQHPNNNLIFRFDLSRKEEVLAHIAKYPSDKYVSVLTSPGIVEFMDPRVTKATGLTMFSQNMNIPMEEIMAFGDMDNDIEMLRTAGWGVCLKNGCDEAKAVSDAVTEYPCTEDGMGKYIEQYVLSV